MRGVASHLRTARPARGESSKETHATAFFFMSTDRAPPSPSRQAASRASRPGWWPTTATRLLRSLPSRVSTASAESPGKSSLTSSACGQPATSVRICAVCRARTRGLVRSRSGALLNSFSPAAALRDCLIPTGDRGLAASSRHRWRSRSNAIACRTINNSIVSSPGVGKLQCVVCSRMLELHPQSLPSSPDFSIVLCTQLARPYSCACVLLREPSHQEQRLGRNAVGRRAGERLQTATRYGGILLYAQLFLPAAQRTKHRIGRLPVDDCHRLQHVAKLLHAAADLVIRLH